MKDEYGIVLDFLEHGHPSGRGQPIAQIIGETYLNLLEVVIRRDVLLKAEDRVYIGEGLRKEVQFIKGRISLNNLTGNAKSELNYVLEKLVRKNEKRYVDFFNSAEPINARMHTLELLPGVGKKHMWQIIEEREKKKFESFDDIKKRVSLLPDPEKMIVRRIKEELEGTTKRYLFVQPPKTKREYY